MGTNNYKQRIGAWGEHQAEAYLVTRGLVLLERNFRTRYGEVDLVMIHGDQLVFVEVKTRSSQKYGLPEESVTPSKQEHLLLAAEQYMEDHPDLLDNWRVDVVAIVGKPGSTPPEILWFENALA